MSGFAVITSAAASPEWACGACTLLNKSSSAECVACSTKRVPEKTADSRPLRKLALEAWHMRAGSASEACGLGFCGETCACGSCGETCACARERFVSAYEIVFGGGHRAVSGSAKSEPSAAAEKKKDDSSSPANSLSLREQASDAWERHCRSGIFVCAICSVCGGSSSGKCECARTRFIDKYESERRLEDASLAKLCEKR